MKLTAEQKSALFQEFGGSETNTGSTEGQVALMTRRIEHIQLHLKTNKKDFSSLRSLLALVGRRRRLLKYLAQKDIAKFRALTAKLGIRK